MACKVPWHLGETCGDYQARVRDDRVERDARDRRGLHRYVGNTNEKSLRRRQEEEEAEAAKTLSRVSKLCPGCARKVQKNGYVRLPNLLRCQLIIR